MDVSALEYKLYYANTWEREEHISGLKPFLLHSYSTLLSQANKIVRGEAMNTNVGVSVHMCIHCGQQFNNNNNLIRHIQICHIDKSYTCPFCYKQSITYDHLKVCTSNVGVTKRYKCKECGRKFLYKYVLTTHMRTHTGERPFKCTQCTKCYTIYGNLKRHMKTHKNEKSLRTLSGEQPFKCL